MFFYHCTAKCVTGTNRTIVRALWPGETAFREAQRLFCFRIPEEILLLEAEPEIIIIIINQRSSIAFMGSAVRIQHLAHYKVSAFTLRVFYNKNRFQQTIRRAARGLFG